ncbi:hypothetical protein BOV88_06105 [Solemya velum gill symbiont]|uniref:Uncharacterized protein n=1 Tax=Solemya velum gill symbiont TaxID=2340 RepID=A0A1T2D8W7_SOVGS|nr:hypothetical protein BOV88_06105 [Solemya velum gill symbiont]OOY37989.1 hypothetical protein BOV89_05020 [Solemya velum gill symbiont]OOY43510.1 hypothetical protein BOV92_11045 [Solemya velum gill symbiont]
MDFDYVRWREAQRVFGNSENIRLEKSEIRNGAKSVNPCHIRPVARGAGIKKGELRSVHLLQLVAIINMKKRSRVAQPVPRREAS